MKPWFQVALLAVGLSAAAALAEPDTFEVVSALEPDTALDTKPPSETYDTSASFSFSSDIADATFECGLEAPGSSRDEPFVPCTSPKTYSGLKEGTYIFFVRAIDAAKNVDSSPAEYTWKVFEVDTFIDSAPARNTSSTSASFQFSGLNGVRYECELDAPGTSKDEAFSNCISPKVYTGLVDGTYTFSVRAFDRWMGGDLSPARHTWTVDRVPPGDTLIRSAPEVISTSKNASFGFSAEGGVSHYECELDAPDPARDESFRSCTSPKEYTDLADGDYSFSVRAVDAAGNKGNIARHLWKVVTIPEVVISFPANGDLLNMSTPVITGTVVPPSSTVHVFIEGRAAGEVLADGLGNWRLPVGGRLSDGVHTVNASAVIGPLGTHGPLSAPNIFTVDTEPPDTQIINPPPKISNSRLAAFELRATGGDTMGFECRLEGIASPLTFTVCPETPVFNKLEDGEYTLWVRARDNAGNVDPTPATYNWTVVVRPPSVPEVLEPEAGATMATAIPSISGRAVPKSTVTIYIDGKKSGVALADESGTWTFRPPVALEVGEHSLTTEATDEAGNISERRSDERVFTILVGKAQSIGGGLSCASSGAQPVSSGLLLAMGLGLTRFRRRSVATQALRGNRSKMSGF